MRKPRSAPTDLLVHGNICGSVAFADHYVYLRNSCGCVKHAPVSPMDAAIIFFIAERSLKSGHIGKRCELDIKSVAEFYKGCCFSCALQRWCRQILRFFAFFVVNLTSVGTAPTVAPFRRRKPGYNIPSVIFLCLKESPSPCCWKAQGRYLPAQCIQIIAQVRFRSSVHSSKESLSSKLKAGDIPVRRICPRISSSVPTPSMRPVSWLWNFALRCIAFGHMVAVQGIRVVYKHFAFLLSMK